MYSRQHPVLAWLGIEPEGAGHREKLLSGLGGVMGIGGIILVSQFFLDGQALPIIVASMGASAVLLFAAPHGKLSQPWNLIGGHLISAFVGVTIAHEVHLLPLAGALAVGLAITAMYYCHCIHPPGGASALVAVVGGPHIHQLGYEYLLFPVGFNVLVILSVAIGFNYFLRWRRYPVAWAPHRSLPKDPLKPSVQQRDLNYALRQLGSYIDVTEDDLETIYTLANEHAQMSYLPVEHIELGCYYSNGAYGEDWSVRQVVDESEGDDENAMLIYKVVAGKDRRSSGTTSKREFAKWARTQVTRNENSWVLMDREKTAESTNT